MGNGGRFLIIWRWVCIPTAPDALLAMGQGTESVRGIKISPEISLGNVAWGHRSELQRQVLITTDDHVLSSMRPKYLEVLLGSIVGMFEARAKLPGTKKRLEWPRKRP